MLDRQPKPSPEPASAVLERAAATMPRVRAPDSPVVFWGGIGGAVLAGLLVFNGLNASRGAQAQSAPPPPPPAAGIAPAQAQSPPAPPPPPAQAAPAIAAVPGVNEDAFLRAPTLVVDLAPTEAPSAGAAAPAALASAPAPAEPVGSDAERFAARTMGPAGNSAQALQMRDLSRIVPQGALISAVLESAINSDLPGAVRGVVSRDVRSFDGSRVLIPRGSRLVGQYKSSASPGQTRAFVVWSRIISPTGVTIDIASPAVDRLGQGGVEGQVDTHFFERFGASILLTLINAGVTAAANSGSNNSNTTLVLGWPGQAGQAAASAIRPADVAPTLRVAQGAAIQVYVARDLDFSGVSP